MKAVIEAAVLKALAGMPKKDMAAMLRKIEQFAAEPFAPNPTVKLLVGSSGAMQVRHGDWRAVCRVNREAQTVVVEFVGNRKEVYR